MASEIYNLKSYANLCTHIFILIHIFRPYIPKPPLSRSTAVLIQQSRVLPKILNEHLKGKHTTFWQKIFVSDEFFRALWAHQTKTHACFFLLLACMNQQYLDKKMYSEHKAILTTARHRSQPKQWTVVNKICTENVTLTLRNP